MSHGQDPPLCCRSQEHRSFPSIVTYITFNEGWGEYDTQRIVSLVKALDPNRLVTAASGWVDPQDVTSGGFWRYDHYAGYVRIPICSFFSPYLIL